jgi:uncharacterized protein YhaN
MKIKEFLITRYGPISHKNKISLTNFNLIWGKNEEGKTLTIDALVKLLLGRNIRDFEHINRVDENPEGYVIIEKDKGEEIKLPEKGNLTKFLDLTPSECCNIFIVRNSNLSIARDVAQEGKFYTNVTDRLTGLRTREISKIKDTLREIGRITPTGIFSDTIKDEKLKTRIENAKDLIGKIESLAKKIKDEGFDELEGESAKQRKKLDGIEQEIKNLEDARKRGKYEKGKEALKKLIGSQEKYKQLEIYNESDEQLWRDCEKDLRTFDEEKKKIFVELKKNEGELKEITEKLGNAERDFKVFDDRKKKIDDEVKPELKNYEMSVGKVKSEEIKNRFYTVATITSAVLLSISILGAIMNTSLIFYMLIVLFLILTTIFAIPRFLFTQKEAHLAAVFARIRFITSKLELGAESPQKIYLNIQQFDEEHQKRYGELQEIKRRKENLDDKIEELQNRTIPGIEKKIEDAKRKIDELKIKEESLEKYTEKLILKKEFGKLIDEKKGILRSHFEEKGKNLEENILHWSQEIDNLEEYKDRASDVKYSEAAVMELKKERQKFESELEEISNRVRSLQKEMSDVEREMNKIILQSEGEYFYCKTSWDLKAINNKLQRFVSENESNKVNVLEVMEIFEEIEVEEKEKISELFGEDSSISKYFTEITDGFYERVAFEQETGKIEVKRRDGKILEAEKLSGGAYDQLYFSIRLALGEKLLKDKKGFFVMDDPFIKADPNRLRRQIEMLKKISESGWQVMYFSAKGEIKNALEEDIEKGTINSVEIQGIFS